MNIITKHTTLLEKSDENIIALDALKKYIRVDFDDEDELLALLIKSAQEEAENIIGKNLLPSKWKQDVVVSYDNYDEDFRFEFPTLSTSMIRIPLTKKPIISTHSVSLDGYKIDFEDYAVKINSENPVLYVRAKALIGLAKNKTALLGITYSAGLFADIKAIPEKIKLGIMMIAANKYFQRDVAADGLGRTRRYAGIKRLLAEFRSYNI